MDATIDWNNEPLYGNNEMLSVSLLARKWSTRLQSQDNEKFHIFLLIAYLRGLEQNDIIPYFALCILHTAFVFKNQVNKNDNILVIILYPFKIKFILFFKYWQTTWNV